MATNKITSQLVQGGKSINNFAECKKEGYSSVACTTAEVIEITTFSGCVAGGTAMISAPTVVTNIAGGALLLSSDKISKEARNATLSLFEKNKKNVVGYDMEMMRQYDSDQLRKLNQTVNINEFKQTMKMEEITESLNNMKTEIKNINNITKKEKEMMSNSLKELSIDSQMIQSYYKEMVLQSCKLSPSIISEMKKDSEFQQENLRLESLINSHAPMNEILNQRKKVDLKIEDKIKKSESFSEFTSNLKIAGEFGTCIANLCQNSELGRAITSVTSTAIQLASIGAGMSGIGPLACMGPCGLAAIGAITIANFAMSMFQSDDLSEAFEAIFEMLKQIAESIHDLKKTMIEMFQNLNHNLCKMEIRLYQHLSENLDLSFSNMISIKRIYSEMIHANEHLTVSVEIIRDDLYSIKRMIKEQETNNLIISIGNLISKCYVNTNPHCISDYKNEIMGRLYHPYEASHPTLVGVKNHISPDSVPCLSINSLVYTRPFSIKKKNELLAKIFENTTIYVSPFMNMTQMVPKMFEMDKKQYEGGKHFYAYYNHFMLDVKKKYGCFLFEVDDTNLLYYFSKSRNTVSIHIITNTNIPFAEIAILLNITQNIGRIFNILSVCTNRLTEKDILSELIRFIWTMNPNLKKETMIVEDDLINFKYENINPLVYTSLVKTALLLQTEETSGKTNETQKRCVTNNELNRFFEISKRIQKNIQVIHTLKHNEKNLVSNYNSSKKSLIEKIDQNFKKEMNYQLSQEFENYWNGAFLEMSSCDSFMNEYDLPFKTHAHGDLNTNKKDFYLHEYIYPETKEEYDKTNLSWKTFINRFRQKHLEYIEKYKKNVRKILAPIEYENNNSLKANICNLPFFIYPDTNIHPQPIIDGPSLTLNKCNFHAKSVGETIVLPMYKEMYEAVLIQLSSNSIFQQYNMLVLLNKGHFIFTYEYNKEWRHNSYSFTNSRHYFMLKLWFKISSTKEMVLIAVSTKLEVSYNIFFDYHYCYTNYGTDRLWQTWCGGLCAYGLCDMYDANKIVKHKKKIIWPYADVYIDENCYLPNYEYGPPLFKPEQIQFHFMANLHVKKLTKWDTFQPIKYCELIHKYIKNKNFIKKILNNGSVSYRFSKTNDCFTKSKHRIQNKNEFEKTNQLITKNLSYNFIEFGNQFCLELVFVYDDDEDNKDNSDVLFREELFADFQQTIKEIEKRSIQNLFEKTTDSLWNKTLNSYFVSVKALETYDYFTHQILSDLSYIPIRNMDDIQNKIIEKKLDFNETKNTFIGEPSITDIYYNENKTFMGDKILKSCLQEIAYVINELSPYVVNEIENSVPPLEIVKEMKKSVDQIYTNNKNLLEAIQYTANLVDLSAEEKVLKIQSLMNQYS